MTRIEQAKEHCEQHMALIRQFQAAADLNTNPEGRAMMLEQIGKMRLLQEKLEADYEKARRAGARR